MGSNDNHRNPNIDNKDHLVYFHFNYQHSHHHQDHQHNRHVDQDHQDHQDQQDNCQADDLQGWVRCLHCHGDVYLSEHGSGGLGRDRWMIRSS